MTREVIFTYEDTIQGYHHITARYSSRQCRHTVCDAGVAFHCTFLRKDYKQGCESYSNLKVSGRCVDERYVDTIISKTLASFLKGLWHRIRICIPGIIYSVYLWIISSITDPYPVSNTYARHGMQVVSVRILCTHILLHKTSLLSSLSLL